MITERRLNITLHVVVYRSWRGKIEMYLKVPSLSAGIAFVMTLSLEMIKISQVSGAYFRTVVGISAPLLLYIYTTQKVLLIDNA